MDLAAILKQQLGGLGKRLAHVLALAALAGLLFSWSSTSWSTIKQAVRDVALNATHSTADAIRGIADFNFDSATDLIKSQIDKTNPIFVRADGTTGIGEAVLQEIEQAKGKLKFLQDSIPVRTPTI